MALLNGDTQQYYKINFDYCKIQGNKIYANYSIYMTEQDRNKDKQRLESMTNFYLKLRELIFNGQKKIDDEFMSFGINPCDSNSNFNLIPLDRLEQIRNEERYIDRFQEIERKLPHKFYIFNDQITPKIDLTDVLSTLIGMGLQMEWITDPIKLDSTMEIYCGDYNGEQIEPSLFYTKMKSVILNTLFDC